MDNTLPQRPLGNTGVTVSAVGLGAVKFGRNRGLRHGAFDLPTDGQARELLAAAADLGVTLIDTAPAYGTSEERLGALLQGRRDRWVIATKAGEAFDGERSTFDFTPEHTRDSVERSLARLRTDRLDVVCIHSSGDDLRIINEFGTIQALRGLQAEGKVRAVGLSTKSPEGGLAAVEVCDVVMLTLNPGYTADLPAFEKAARLGKGVLVKKALQSGDLGGLAPDGDPVERCMRFVFNAPGVSSVIVGTLSQAHLAHDVRAAVAAIGAAGASGAG